ncbi:MULTISPECIES: HXXEE domain-containing protein [Paenibacillus]|uniref:HXXEE domain-containing protein n=1 Tax=Paenibacillus TaxID=44249 RepID=UPI000B809BA6|nr:HXXEE domain-containing protein [Paenibacillus amylolyticus]
MNVLRKYWQDLGLVIGLLVCIYVAVDWETIPRINSILWFSFVAILLHQFEEYRWPGYFPGVFNTVLFKSDSPERYPLNKQSAMIINVFIAYLFYLIPVVFPSVVWLGLAPVLMGFFQIVFHGLVLNVKAKTIYNPGLFTAIFLHLPIGIWYIRYVHEYQLITVTDWIVGVIYFAIAVYIFIVKGNTWLKNKNSIHTFSPKELALRNKK